MKEIVLDYTINKQFRNAMKCSFHKVRAIYEPLGYGPYGECYIAAIDMFKPGMTFRLYFKVNGDGTFYAEHIEKWHSD